MNFNNSLSARSLPRTVLCLALISIAAVGGYAAEEAAGEDIEDLQAPLSAPVDLTHASGAGAVLLSEAPEVTFSLATGKNRDAAGYVLLAPDGQRIPLTVVRNKGATTTFSLAKAPAEGWYPLGVLRANQTEPVAGQGVRVVRRFRIALTFDDGPATGGDPADGDFTASPTSQTLEALDQFRHGPGGSLRGIKAAFFVLSQPDTFLRDRFLKAETADGCALLREEAKRGHVIGVHWGGRYLGQTVCHTRRVGLPAYEWWRDPQAARAEDAEAVPGENALESDLRECIARIRQCAGVTPRYLRPPLWKYSDSKNPQIARQVLDTYRRLGLKMILTDAKYPDGGYAILSIVNPNELSKFQDNLRRAYQSGEDELIVSMHDSNTHTAHRLPQVLELIKTTFAAMDWGKQQADPGLRLEFAATGEDVEAVLQHKTRFVMFPAYRPEAE